jgi:hypothetical protein
MTNKEKARRDAFVKRVHKKHRELGGRVTADTVATHMRASASTAEKDAWEWQGCRLATAAALRATNPDTGLPLAPCIAGKHVQDSLLTKEDFGRLIADHYAAVKRESARVKAYRERCHAVHGVWLDAAECYRKYGS